MATATVTVYTLAKCYDEIQAGVPGSPWVPLGNFMMDFFRNVPGQRAALLADPIQVQQSGAASKSEEDEAQAHQWAVFCAASAEYLAHRYGLDCPEWVHDPAYAAVAAPWYFAPMALKKPHVRARIEQQTPEEFAKRNIYCGNRVYVDKYEEAQQFRHIA
jgi:hypothetical protein